MPKPNKRIELPNDGERMVPQHHKGTAAYGDHIVRYSSVETLVKNKVVLDIASGSGYGSQILAKNAKKVYGVDIEKGAVEYARKNFNASNVEYKVGSGTAIPLEDQSVDVVVSLETIEHIEDSNKFVEEVKRVLRPDGLAIISTPNDLEFPEGNHFHVHEYTHGELVALLSKHFINVDSYFQGTWYYTGLSKADMMFKGWDKNIRVINASPLKEEQVLFFLLICSNEPIKDFIEPMGVIAEHISARDIQVKSQLTEQHLNNLSDIVESTKQYATDLQEMIKEKDKLINELQAEVTNFHKSPVLYTAKRLKKQIGSKLKKA